MYIYIVNIYVYIHQWALNIVSVYWALTLQEPVQRGASATIFFKKNKWFLKKLGH
jgi:hypothetical protein